MRLVREIILLWCIGINYINPPPAPPKGDSKEQENAYFKIRSIKHFALSPFGGGSVGREIWEG